MDKTSSLMATSEDIEGINQTARDYVEGWFNADVERMRRCLHPDLVKRSIQLDPQRGTWELLPPANGQMMVAYTQDGGGSDAPEAEKTFEITVLDVFRHITTVKVLSYPFMDYLHLAKLNDRWLIVNVLWELRQGELSADS